MNKLINVGINIIDHIFIPSVLTALVGFLALWIDKDGNGIPDKLEEPKLPTVNTTERSDKKRKKGLIFQHGKKIIMAILILTLNEWNKLRQREMTL